jgi:hypothetical protein
MRGWDNVLLRAAPRGAARRGAFGGNLFSLLKRENGLRARGPHPYIYELTSDRVGSLLTTMLLAANLVQG